MKTPTLVTHAASALVLLGLLAGAGSSLGQTTSYSPAVYIFSPTNNATYLAPVSLTIYARAIARTGTVATVEFFANSASLGVVTNGPGVQVTNGIPEPAFPLSWPNVAPGHYELKALVTDSQGLTATSSVVNVSVILMPNLPLAIKLSSPTNGQTFTAPARIGLYTQVLDSNIVRTVEFFAGTTSLGTVTNLHGTVLTNANTANPFYLTWSNVLVGTYTLTTLATDTAGIMATSPPVTVTVNPAPPPHPSVYVRSPTNGSMYLAPAALTLYARAAETGGTVQTVQFFAGDHSLGVVSNASQVVVTNLGTEPLFPLAWSNVLAGSYALKAVATDAAGMTATSAVASISVVTSWPVVRPSVGIYSPLNGSKFLAPTNLTLYARAYEGNTGVVQTVEFFAGHTSLGIVPNSSQVVVSNISSVPLFPLAWPNVPVGTYALTAVATDAAGVMATSSVVSIAVISNVPPPIVPYAVGFWYPTNGQSFTAPASIGLHAWVTDSNIVRTVQYFAGTTSIGIVTNTSGVLLTNTTGANPFFLLWSNVLAGSYPLTAVATDSAGLTATSPTVNVTVLAPPPHTNWPPSVRISSPPNAAVFHTPVNIPIYAYAYDSDGVVTSVEFKAGTNSLGFGGPVLTGTNEPTNHYSTMFSLVWSNAPVGAFPLTAVATDNSNAVSVSSVVNISIVPPSPPVTNRLPVVYLTATDPLAIVGTNCWVWSGQTNTSPTWTNWPSGTVPVTNCGPKNATFSVYRSGDTNNPLTVLYGIGGTATNGLDYVLLSGVATIPASQRQTMISIVPLDDGLPDVNSTVILKLLPSTNSPVAYTIGSQASAGALIVDSTQPRPATAALSDRTFHLQADGPNGAWFSVQYSTDTLHWTSICTNQVVNGSIDFIDPTAPGSPTRFYRAVPEAKAP